MTPDSSPTKILYRGFGLKGHIACRNHFVKINLCYIIYRLNVLPQTWSTRSGTPHSMCPQDQNYGISSRLEQAAAPSGWTAFTYRVLH
eukprot:COSAG02_NODE_1422_length_12685_cov_69.610361_14_plen_88_part_00